MPDLSQRKSEFNSEYKYGWHDPETAIFETKKGLNKQIVEQISDHKNEPDWMRDQRIEAYEKFASCPLPNWGPDLTKVKFNDYKYYKSVDDSVAKTWDEVPERVKDTFEKLGIPEAERAFLAGVATQYDSVFVYQSMQKELQDLGVIFCSTDEAVVKYPELTKEYFGKLVKNSENNKFALLNSAVWSGGTFIYVPKGVKIERPLQSYFRINAVNLGQFERTLIIVDEGAEVHYVEGCTAPLFSEHNLHAAVVEVYVKKNATCKYTTIQTWSDKVYNLVTKRSIVEENGSMEWVDGNIGSYLNMKYPSTILKGDNSTAKIMSIAIAKDDTIQDAGAKMIHIGKNTKSQIISKSVGYGTGEVTYRGLVDVKASAIGSKTNVECDTLLLDEESRSDTLPTEIISNNQTISEHEATVSTISEEQLFYLMSRGIDEEKARGLIVRGFLEPFTKELPMEYAVELNKFIELDMEGSIG